MIRLGSMNDQELCDILNDLHKTSPMFQTEKERLEKVLDRDYSKVDIDNMVNNLDIVDTTKQKLKPTLKKYPTLFGGGMGTLDMRLVEIELKPDAKLYASKFYNVAKAYDRISKSEVICLCNVDVLEKLIHTTDSLWTAPSFCQLKKLVVLVF